MKRITKLTLTFLLTFSFIFSSGFFLNSDTYAMDSNNQCKEEQANTIDSTHHPLRIGLTEKCKYLGTRTIVRTVTLPGQNYPLAFSTRGGVFVYDGGPTVSMSLSVGNEVVNFGMSLGYVQRNKRGGKYVEYPPDGKAYVVTKTVKIRGKLYKCDLVDHETGRGVLQTYYKLSDEKILSETIGLKRDYR